MAQPMPALYELELENVGPLTILGDTEIHCGLPWDRHGNI